MEITQKKHWRNGHQIRGGHFNTYAFQIFSLGVIVYYSIKNKPRNISISLYKLVK